MIRKADLESARELGEAMRRLGCGAQQLEEKDLLSTRGMVKHHRGGEFKRDEDGILAVQGGLRGPRGRCSAEWASKRWSVGAPEDLADCDGLIPAGAKATTQMQFLHKKKLVYPEKGDFFFHKEYLPPKTKICSARALARFCWLPKSKIPPRVAGHAGHDRDYATVTAGKS